MHAYMKEGISTYYFDYSHVLKRKYVIFSTSVLYMYHFCPA